VARPERGALEDIDRLFHALGDPTRRRMIELLGERPFSVSAVADRFGVTLTAISQHLRLLEEAGLVRTEKLGRTRSCQLEPGGLAQVQAWLLDRRSTWERRLDDLARILDEES